MKKIITAFAFAALVVTNLNAQIEPNAGNWKTWFISSAKEYRLKAPATYKNEIAQVISCQKSLDEKGMLQITFWNAGDPAFRWHEMLRKLWPTDISGKGMLAQMLLGTATYDATIVAWDTKNTYKRPRPFEADKRIIAYGPKIESYSYPCEHSVAAGVASTIIGYFFPKLKDSANRMAQQLMASRIAAGMAFPSDTQAGFDLGKLIAEKEIEATKDYLSKVEWDKKMPQGPQYWRGSFAMFPTAGQSKTVVLTSASQFRPPPPPDFAKDMAELKNFKQTFSSSSNAFHYANNNPMEELLKEKILEYNLALNPPRAARDYAIAGVAVYDCFVACFDAKYAYWGIRPDQYDTTYKPIVPTPPFPGYPSGHATMCGMIEVLYSYLFPNDKAAFQKVAKDGAESRFQAGIHFRTDNEVGLDLGRKVANAIIQRVKNDGADEDMSVAKMKK